MLEAKQNPEKRHQWNSIRRRHRVTRELHHGRLRPERSAADEKPEIIQDPIFHNLDSSNAAAPAALLVRLIDAR